MSHLTAIRHSATLDSIRALSAVVVLFGHAAQIFWYPAVGLHGVIHRTTNILTESAVIVFFLLSGYLITASIDSNIRRHGRLVPSEYLVARLARIYPPLFAAILLTAGIFAVFRVFDLPGISSPLRGSGDVYSARDMLSLSNSEIRQALIMNGGLLVMNGPLWSLYIEVQLYAAAGVFAWLLFGAGAPGIRFVVGVPLLVLLLGHSTSRLPHFPLYAAWWLVGVVSYGCRMKSRVSPAAAVMLLGLGGVVLGLTTASRSIEACRVPIMLALCWAMFSRWTWRSSILESLAGSSYTLYLIHFPLSLLTYSVLIAFCGDDAIQSSARLAATVIAVMVSIGLSLILAQFTEDTVSSKLYLMRFLRLGGFGAHAPAR